MNNNYTFCIIPQFFTKYGFLSNFSFNYSGILQPNRINSTVSGDSCQSFEIKVQKRLSKHSSISKGQLTHNWKEKNDFSN
jgi:hypothetical protein